MSDRSHRLLLLGYGGVGRAFAEALTDAASDLRARYDLVLELSAVRRSRTEWLPDRGRHHTDPTWTPARDLATLLRETAPDIVIQTTPSGAGDADGAFDDAVAALQARAHLVTATKAHLVRRWGALGDAGLSAGRAIRVSAAAGAALPAVDLARRGVRGFGCERIRASLNGTSNYVLNEYVRGSTFGRAVEKAQEAGIAERDPTGDLDGSDAAAKLVILSNLLWRRDGSLDDVERQPIDEQSVRVARRETGDGLTARPIATAVAAAPEMSVRLELIPLHDPFAALSGAEKAVEFDGPAGRILVSGGRSSPRGAALALLKDVTNVLTGDDAPGFG